jgi:hypothetical protein
MVRVAVAWHTSQIGNICYIRAEDEDVVTRIAKDQKQ